MDKYGGLGKGNYTLNYGDFLGVFGIHVKLQGV